MIRIVRREVVAGGLLTLFWGTKARCQISRTSDGGGCWIPHRQVASYFALATKPSVVTSGAVRIEPRSGRPELDRAFAQSLAMMAGTFGVLPAFTYYDDNADRNARATPEPILDRADGTVMFGLTMLRDLLEDATIADAAIVSVAAHEFGHIVSFKNGMINDLVGEDGAPYRSEQFADYMSGYFSGRRKLERPSFKAFVFVDVLGGMLGGGDHGSARQRGEAVHNGFAAAFAQKLSLDDAIQTGYRFAMSRKL